MSEWIFIEEDCAWPESGQVVQVKLSNGFTQTAMFDCDIGEAGDWDLMPLDENGEPTMDSVADKAIAWRSAEPFKDSTATTLKHIRRVNELLIDEAQDLLSRAKVHDESKFSDIEKSRLDRMEALIEREGQAAFGTEEYKRRTDMLGPMVEHHRRNNDHHPEFHPDGVKGMDLVQLLEMFCDWKAASERGEESAMNLTFACEKYGVSDQLKSIFIMTANRRGWAWK